MLKIRRRWLNIKRTLGIVLVFVLVFSAFASFSGVQVKAQSNYSVFSFPVSFFTDNEVMKVRLYNTFQDMPEYFTNEDGSSLVFANASECMGYAKWVYNHLFDSYETGHPNQAGYYGEILVLYAQTLGLNTCWALLAGKKEAKSDLDEGYRNVISISVGYGENQGRQHKNRPVEEVADLEGAPDWFIRGVNCAMLAPTGRNRQAFRFEREGDKVRLIAGNSTLSQIDRGIVRFHFEYGAGKDNFTWIE